MSRETPEETRTRQLAQIGADAAERHADAHPLYVVTVLLVQVSMWGDIFGAIEGEGWRLDQFSVAPQGHGVAIFRAIR